MVDAYLSVMDNGLSVRKSAQKYGIPAITLSLRLRGIPAKVETVQRTQWLSPTQEERLTTWILKQEALGFAPSHSVVCEAVISLLKLNGDNDPLGKHWIEGFKSRNPTIHTKIGRRQEASRFNGFKSGPPYLGHPPISAT